MLLGGMALTCNAQNNPQRINDTFYPMYVKAYNLRKSADCLPIADSLHTASVAAGDRQGEVYALSIPFLYEFYRHDNLTGVERAMKPFMEKAEAYGMSNLYYYAISMKVAYYTREHRYIEALMYLDKQNRLAKQKGHVEGQMSLCRMLGVIRHFRGELPQAIAAYTDAIESYKANHFTRYISREYLSIADCYRMMGDYEHLAEAAEEALPYCVIQADRCNVFTYECYGYFMLGRDAEFLDRYEYLTTHRQKLDNSYVIMNKAVEACKAIYDHRDADALRIVDDIAKVSKEESYRLCIELYKRRGDYLKSIDYMRKILEARHELNERTFAYDQKSRDDIFRDQHLEAERQRIINANTRLRLSNARNTLRNSSLELSRHRDAARIAEAEAARSLLAASNQQLAARQLRDSIARQQIVQNTREKKQQTEYAVLMALLAMAAAAMIMTVAFVCRKRLLARRLLAANDSLADNIGKLNAALYRAQESNRMKTLFIQNMSQDIRTPLNAIVGLSQLLTSGNDSLNSEEACDTARYIAENSDLLTKTLNDIIDHTSRQSSGDNTAKK